jgi:lysozyme family protein
MFKSELRGFRVKQLEVPQLFLQVVSLGAIRQPEQATLFHDVQRGDNLNLRYVRVPSSRPIVYSDVSVAPDGLHRKNLTGETSLLTLAPEKINEWSTNTTIVNHHCGRPQCNAVFD